MTHGHGAQALYWRCAKQKDCAKIFHCFKLENKASSRSAPPTTAVASLYTWTPRNSFRQAVEHQMALNLTICLTQPSATLHTRHCARIWVAKRQLRSYFPAHKLLMNDSGGNPTSKVHLISIYFSTLPLRLLYGRQKKPMSSQRQLRDIFSLDSMMAKHPSKLGSIWKR